MQAFVIQQFGEPTVFQPTDLPIPKLSPHHVLIRVFCMEMWPELLKLSGMV
jgi:NADPH:quinone reductase